jgi:hypothetical protein
MITYVNTSFEKQFGPIPERFITALEQGWHIKLPRDYKEFLVKINGGKPQKKLFTLKDKSNSSLLSGLFGISDEEDYNVLIRYPIMLMDRIPTNTFPIADDQCGNLILLSIRGQDYGKVYFWDHEREVGTDHGVVADYSNLTLIADSFNEFVNNLKDESEIED